MKKNERTELVGRLIRELRGQIKEAVKKSWHKWAILGLFAYLITEKDLSFQVDLNAAGLKLPTLEQGVPLSVASEEAASFSIKEQKEVKPALSPAELKKRKKQLDYVSRFREVAVSEMQKYGIPASITLAQGILESGSGNSKLAKENNNHFGIKCFRKKCSKGHCTNFEDDHHKDFFVRYESAWYSYRAHSELLNAPRYAGLKSHGKDYRSWAEGLQKAGYATSKQYARKLISLIEDLELYHYDD